MNQRVDQQAADTKRGRRLAIAGMLLSVLIFGSNFAISRYSVLHGIGPLTTSWPCGSAPPGCCCCRCSCAKAFISCAGVGWGRGLFLLVSSGFPMSFLMLTGLGIAPAAHGATITPGTVTIIGIVGSVVMFGAIVTHRLVIGVVGMLLGFGLPGDRRLDRRPQHAAR